MSKYKFETLQLHAGQENPDPATGARAVPIYASAAYVFPSSESAAARFDLKEAGNIYSRLGDPTAAVLEQRMAALEGGAAAVVTASGTAATTAAIQNICSVGDHIVSANSLYGGTFNYFSNSLPEMGITTTFVDINDLDGFRNAIKPNTKLLFIEAMGNPNCDIGDVEKIAEIAHENGIPLFVDNTFGTPYLFRPIEHGADIVLHSATKFIGGHGAVLGGVVVDGGKFDWAKSGKFKGLSEPNPNYHGTVFTEIAGNVAFAVKMRTTILRDFGACLSPFNSWALLLGLETLSLRVERHVENSIKVIDFLTQHKAVVKVNHPSLKEHPNHDLYNKYFPKGGGSIFTIELETKEKAKTFCEKLKLFSLLANVADQKSLVIHPATTTHSQLDEEQLKACGISGGTVRLSIGTENIDDILSDLTQALEF